MTDEPLFVCDHMDGLCSESCRHRHPHRWSPLTCPGGRCNVSGKNLIHVACVPVDDRSVVDEWIEV